MTLEELEEKVRLLDDIEQIKQLMSNYTYSLDYRELDKLMDNFVDDSKIEIRVRGALEKGVLAPGEGTYAPSKGTFEATFNGKKAIEELYSSMLPEKPPSPEKNPFASAHLISNPAITVQGEKAKGRWYLLCPYTSQKPEGPAAVWEQGTYDNEFVKVNGEWKISSFRFTFNFYTPYEDGWAKTLMAGL